MQPAPLDWLSEKSNYGSGKNNPQRGLELSINKVHAWMRVKSHETIFVYALRAWSFACAVRSVVIILGRGATWDYLCVYIALKNREKPRLVGSLHFFSSSVRPTGSAASKVNLADVIAFRARVNANSRLAMPQSHFCLRRRIRSSKSVFLSCKRAHLPFACIGISLNCGTHRPK